MEFQIEKYIRRSKKKIYLISTYGRITIIANMGSPYFRRAFKKAQALRRC